MYADMRENVCYATDRPGRGYCHKGEQLTDRDKVTLKQHLAQRL